MADPSDYQMNELGDYQMVDPRNYQMVDPRTYQMADPRGYQMAEHRRYQMGEPSSNQTGEPSSNQMGEPSSNQMGEPSSNQMSESKVCPVLHARVAINEYERACFMAEQLSRGPPAMYYEDHVYYKVQVHGGRLWMKMFGSCDKSLNRLDFDIPPLGATSGVVRKLIGRGIDEPLEFTINEEKKSNKLHEMLTNSLGIFRRVARDRKVYTADRANIILDTVKDIGYFVQITVTCQPGQTIDEGKSVATFILQSLGVKDQHRIAPFCEYIDLEPWPVHKEKQSHKINWN